MKKLITALVVVIASVAGTNAIAGAMVGSDLYKFCMAADPKSLVACRFYILGAVEGISLAATVLKDNKHFCIPANVTQSEMVSIVRIEMEAAFREYPEDKNAPAIELVGDAMASRYPCGR